MLIINQYFAEAFLIVWHWYWMMWTPPINIQSSNNMLTLSLTVVELHIVILKSQSLYFYINWATASQQSKDTIMSHPSHPAQPSISSCALWEVLQVCPQKIVIIIHCVSMLRLPVLTQCSEHFSPCCIEDKVPY